MAIGWIDSIYNNTNNTIKLASKDSGHHGILRSFGIPNIDLKDNDFHDLDPNTPYNCEWCGIPWYWQNSHFKAIEGVHELRFCTSFRDGANWVLWQDGTTGATRGMQQVSKNADFHCVLRFERDTASANPDAEPPLVFLDVVNDDGSTNEVIKAIRDETIGWIETTAPILAEVVKAILDGK